MLWPAGCCLTESLKQGWSEAGERQSSGVACGEKRTGGWCRARLTPPGWPALELKESRPKTMKSVTYFDFNLLRGRTSAIDERRGQRQRRVLDSYRYENNIPMEYMRSIDLSLGTPASSFIRRTACVPQMFLPLQHLAWLKTNLAYSAALWPPSIFKHNALDRLSVPTFNDSHMQTTVLFSSFWQERRVYLKPWDRRQ